MDYKTRMSMLQDYYNLGATHYGKWIGPSTYTDKTVESWFDSFVEFIPMDYLCIYELGPSGGAWTNLLLSKLTARHMPAYVTLYLIGTEAEAKLTERDTLSFYDLKLGVSRVRSLKDSTISRRGENLITEFTVQHFDILNDSEALDKLQYAGHLVYSFNLLQWLYAEELKWLFDVMTYISYKGSAFFCNFAEFSDCSTSIFEEMSKENFKLMSNPAYIPMPHQLNSTSVVAVETPHYKFSRI